MEGRSDGDKSQRGGFCLLSSVYCLQRTICYVSRLVLGLGEYGGAAAGDLIIEGMTIAKSAINLRFTILIEGA